MESADRTIGGESRVIKGARIISPMYLEPRLDPELYSNLKSHIVIVQVINEAGVYKNRLYHVFY